MHDNVDGPPDWVQDATVEESQMWFGAGATLYWRISSSSPTSRRATPTSDWWNGAANMGGKYGRCMSDSDKERVRNYMAGLITTSLERRVGELNDVVSERKKGARNVFSSFWRTSNKDDTTTSSSSGSGGASSSLSKQKGQSATTRAKHQHDSVEAQVLLLADLILGR